MLRRGFTLIELSIVLVVIGLLVGGVLAGRTLIASAEIRKIGTQIEAINTATSTFRSKYNCLPGDCPNATKFGFQLDGVGTADGNGDGAIGSADQDTWFNNGSENVQFFRMLISANLLEDRRYCKVFAGVSGLYCNPWSGQHGYTDTTGFAVPGSSAAKISIFNVPKWKANYGITGGYDVTFEHLYLFASSVRDGGGVLSASLAQQVDGKYDDGIPLTGTIRALGVNPSPSIGFVDDNRFYTTILGCMNRTTSPYSYQTGNTADPGCSLIWKTGF